MEDDQEILAHKLYDDYCEAVGGVAFNGDPLPKSEEFFRDKTKIKQANAWRITSGSAIKWLGNKSTEPRQVAHA